MWKREDITSRDNIQNTPSDISPNLQYNISHIKEIFKDNENLKSRTFKTKGEKPFNCAVFYTEGLSNFQIVSERFIRGIMGGFPQESSDPIQEIYEHMVCECDVQIENKEEKIVSALTYGDSVLFVDGCKKALIANTKGWITRAITEPENEKVLQGPREGFNEKISDSISLIQRKLCTPDFKVKFFNCGRRSSTRIAICYLDSVVKKGIVENITKKISAIDIDGILDSNYIKEIISDKKFSPFKTIGSSERPDTVAARLLEGRVAIIVNGSPVVLTAPFLFIENFQSGDDYYINYIAATVGRLLRIMSFILAISIPAIYVALVTVHKEMMPTNLAISIISARSSVPFPVIVETLGLILVFEIIRETALRMPSNVSQAFSIVGAIVIGDSAVKAKFVSVPIVIIVSLSALAGLMIPRLRSAVVTYRILLTILSGLLGLYGYIFGVVFMTVQLLDTKSFGVNYMEYISIPKINNQNDIYLRLPWNMMKKRPRRISHNKTRQRANDE